jgi:hypothetical protein
MQVGMNPFAENPNWEVVPPLTLAHAPTGAGTLAVGLRSSPRLLHPFTTYPILLHAMKPEKEKEDEKTSSTLTPFLETWKGRPFLSSFAL